MRPGRPARLSRRPLAGLVAAALAAAGALAAVPLPATAAARAFTPVFTQDTTGDVLIRGNTLLTCPTGSTGSNGKTCASVQAGTANALNNHFTMAYVDTDTDPDTFNSSSATVTVPDGAEVLFAGLTWGGATSAGAGGVVAPDADKKDTAKLSVPGFLGYTTLVSTTVDFSGAYYQAFADVTEVVSQAGSGDYTVADVQAGTGAGGFAGWALTVVYEDPREPMRNLVVFTGFDGLQSGGGSLDLPVSGFTTPANGPVVTRLGVVAYEGDRLSKGDTMALEAHAVVNATNPSDDVFNSSLTDLAAPVTDRNPSYTNLLGYDIDRFDVSGVLANGATSATISLSTSGDAFLPGVLTFATDLYATALTADKSVTDANGGDVVPGDQLNYSIEVESTKTDAAVQSVLTDEIPKYATYVDGSLAIDATPVTDAPGDDAGHVVDGAVTAHLGTGATSAGGGRLASGATATVSFSVTVDAGANDGRTIENTAALEYESESNLQELTGASNEVTSTVVVAPVIGSSSPPPGQVSVGYLSGLTVEGGTGPYAWSISVGALPPGVTLDATTGSLSGTPTVAGTYEFTAMVKDANDRTDTEELTLEVSPSVSVVADDSEVLFGAPVQLTATNVPSSATGTVTFTVVPSSGADSGNSVELDTVPLTGGSAQTTIAMPAFGLNEVTATYNGDEDHPSSTSTPIEVEVLAEDGQLLVTEFRASGPEGPEDAYIEIANTGDPIPLGGFSVHAGAGTVATFPADAGTLETGRSVLLTGATFSLDGVATGDLPIGDFGQEGISVVAPDTAATVVDAVGTSSGSHEGNPLPAMTSEPADEHAWWRLQNAGAPVDTADNAADFVLVSTSGAVVGGVQSTIGSPSPTGATTAFRHNGVLQSELLDPNRLESASPNRVYVPGNPGTLTVRRTVINTSSRIVTEAKVRITALSALHGAPRPDGTLTSGSQAQLRVVAPSSNDTSRLAALPGISVVGLVPDAPSGPQGGGLNTTLTVPLPNGGLQPGEVVPVAFTFAVDAPGHYWFAYDVDALSTESGGCNTSTTMGATVC